MAALVQTAPGGDRGMAQTVPSEASRPWPGFCLLSVLATACGSRPTPNGPGEGFRSFAAGGFLGEAEFPDDGIDTADDQNFTGLLMSMSRSTGVYRQPAAVRIP